MINWIHDHLPICIKVDCAGSEYLEELTLSFLQGVVIIKMISGELYSVPVPRLEMLKFKNYDNADDLLYALLM